MGEYDIAEIMRNRARGGYAHDGDMEDAADEIDRLRAKLAEAKGKVTELHEKFAYVSDELAEAKARIAELEATISKQYWEYHDRAEKAEADYKVREGSVNEREETRFEKIERLKRELAIRQSELVYLVLGDPRVSVSMPDPPPTVGGMEE